MTESQGVDHERVAPPDASEAAEAPLATAGAVPDPAAAAAEERTRRTPSKVSPVKKAAASKPRPTKTDAKKRTAKKAKPTAAATGQQAKFPRHSVEKALRIPKAVYDQNGGKPATRAEAVKFAGAQALSGALNVEISSSLKYGYFKADGQTLVLTDRARAAVAPQSDNERVTAFRDAVLAAPDLSDVYNYYRGESLPDAQYFTNALTDRFRIPSDKVAEFQQVFDESIRSADLLDVSGPRPRLIDVGRDEEHRGQQSTKALSKSRAAVPIGSSCFVMQPFAGPLGAYYESIFKPAILQAGLTPLRADAEIFATGKIIDQIWRGIREATVLVAELTTKNANVFYELGLAHALEKPVVLVSSNEQDVPFDLRHIRVIVYDQTDPFWGQKLIDKVADNIRSAISNPEEAIFRVDGSGPERQSH
ncbi:hypothetical protein [Blastococcus goldschmidtiae]|uniref:Nucleoside 2-deoxyribosyltransferase n=1 Tax=Blastococcus goldschmidtiae TaxID=3075546 RepID=A0ABU2KDB4_9ACTN|nr:hypothetical protein [Blastococcus sp. DSM 46792]MDT0278158.1 hypothetical protein [Blastococcus sp. DSM 46792]